MHFLGHICQISSGCGIKTGRFSSYAFALAFAFALSFVLLVGEFRISMLLISEAIESKAAATATPTATDTAMPVTAPDFGHNLSHNQL